MSPSLVELAWRRPPIRFALPALAVVAAVAVLGVFLLSNQSPAVAPSPSAAPSAAPTSGEATPSATLTTGVSEAPAVARIPLPHPAAGTAFPGQTAVTDGAIWIASFDGEHLVRIDAATNAVTANVPIAPALLATGEGQLWMLTPYGGAPSPATYDIWQVDTATGEPRHVAAVPAALRLAVGLGGVWVADGSLRLIDPSSGAVIRTLSASGQSIGVACGWLWLWNAEFLSGTGPPPGGSGDRATLDRIDPGSGVGREHFDLPSSTETRLTEADGLCWAVDGRALIGIQPGAGVVSSSEATDQVQVAGDTFWTASTDGVVQQVDPMTGNAFGQAWQLPAQDLHRDPKGQADWRLLGANGSLWLLGGDELVRYGIPLAP